MCTECGKIWTAWIEYADENGFSVTDNVRMGAFIDGLTAPKEPDLNAAFAAECDKIVEAGGHFEIFGLGCAVVIMASAVGCKKMEVTAPTLAAAKAKAVEWMRGRRENKDG